MHTRPMVIAAPPVRVDEAIDQSLREHGMDLVWASSIYAYLDDDEDEWPRCCGSACDPCVATLANVTRRVKTLLEEPMNSGTAARGEGAVSSTPMSVQVLRCQLCGALLTHLDSRCAYCSAWNTDPANPRPPPPAIAPVEPPAPAPAPTPAAEAPPPASAMVEVPARRFGARRSNDPKPIEKPPSRRSLGDTRPLAVQVPTVRAGDSSERGVKFLRVLDDNGAMESWNRGRSAWGTRRESLPTPDENDESLARVEATLAAVYYVANADGDIAQEEYDGIVEAFTELLGESADTREVAEVMEEWDALLDEDGDEDFLTEIADTLTEAPARRAAFELAAAVAAVDGELSGDEEDALSDLANVFGFSDREAERLVARALRKVEEG